MALTAEPRVNKLSAIFDPLNLLLIFLNCLFFVGIELLFFMEVLSKQVQYTVFDLGESLVPFTANVPGLSVATEELLLDQEYISDIKKRATEEKKRREEKNKNLIKEMMFPVLGAIGGINVLLVLWILAKGEKLVTVDYFLLLCVLLAFTSEFIFFLLVVQRIEYIGPLEALAGILKIEETREV